MIDQIDVDHSGTINYQGRGFSCFCKCIRIFNGGCWEE